MHAAHIGVHCGEELAGSRKGHTTNHAMVTGSGRVPLCSVAKQAQVGGALAVGRRLGRVLGVVKDVHLRIDGLGCYEERVLRHVPRPIDLALMVDLLGDLQCGCAHSPETSQRCSRLQSLLLLPDCNGSSQRLGGKQSPRRGTGCAPQAGMLVE